MGNANSTSAQAISPSNTSTPSRRTSRPDSPSIKTDLNSNSNSSQKTATTIIKGRRKKSIELSDVDTSLNFTSPHTTTTTTSILNSSGGGSNNSNSKTRRNSNHGRRKNAGMEISNALGEDNSGSGEDELEPVAGTLRGAMQGRAEHVVYGPRRDDTAIPGTTIFNSVSSSIASSSKPIPTRLSNSLGSSIDPDDTTHPDYKASPRLTSAVLLSQDKMPVLVSPKREDFPSGSPFGTSSSTTKGGLRVIDTTTTSLAGVSATIAASSSILPPSMLNNDELLPPHTSAPYPPSIPPTNSVLAPIVPTNSLPLSIDQIPSGTGVIPTPPYSLDLSSSTIQQQQQQQQLQSQQTNPSFLLPPSLFNAPVAAIPIPLLSVPSATIAASLLAAAVDLGAGAEGVPTLIKWKDEDGQYRQNWDGANARPKGPKEVFVTGTFSNGWKTKIELRKNDASDFSALISLPPGPHRLKFIVDKEWKASKHLPVATDADGNLINYLHVNPGGNNKATAEILDWTNPTSNNRTLTSVSPTTGTTSNSNSNSRRTNTNSTNNNNTSSSSKTSALNTWNMLEDTSSFPEDNNSESGGWELEDSIWTSEIPKELIEWGEWEAERELLESNAPEGTSITPPPPPASSSGVPPPTLPAQLEKGPLNHAAYVTQGSGDDNSILPKPDHSVINHLAASPIKGGFLSVGVTTRYKRKVSCVDFFIGVFSFFFLREDR